MIFALAAIVWLLAALLELAELVEPLDGTTHAVSVVAFLGMGLLNLVVFRLERSA